MMSKAKQLSKHKYERWVSQKQYNCVMDSMKKLSKEIRIYKLKDDIKFYKNLTPSSPHINNTMDMFNIYSCKNGYEATFLSKIKKSLNSITRYDIVFELDKKRYLYHTYKILGFIREAILAHKLSNDEKFLEGTIGAYGLNKEYYLDEYNRHKQLALKDTNINKGSDLLTSFIFRNFYIRPHLLKHFFSSIAFIGIENIKMLDSDTHEIRVLKRACRVYMSGRVSQDDVANSLLSVLYFYLLFTMRISKKLALTIAKNLVYDVFKIYKSYTGSEILKNLHVKDVIGSHIVYGFSTKTEFLKEHQKVYLENTLVNSLDILDIDKYTFPTNMIRPLIDNPLQVYTLLTPSELMQEIS